MRVLDNIEKVLNLLTFRPDLFYYIQVIARKKENSDLQRDTQLISKCISTLEEFNAFVPVIKSLCESFNARCYISLCPRSIEKYTKEINLKTSERIFNNAYSSRIFRYPDSIAQSKNNIQWKGVFPFSLCMLDVDYTDKISLDSLDSFLRKGGIKVIDILPSLNGRHYLCRNFYPKELGASQLHNEDWIYDENERRFTLCRDLNVILYASIQDKSL